MGYVPINSAVGVRSVHYNMTAGGLLASCGHQALNTAVDIICMTKTRNFEAVRGITISSSSRQRLCLANNAVLSYNRNADVSTSRRCV